MGRCVIDHQSVAAPERCRLLLDVDGRRLGVAVVDRLHPAEALWREVELAAPPAAAAAGAPRAADPALAGEPLARALEEAVYDNPVLLAGFDRVDVVVATPWLALLPGELSALGEARAAVARASMPAEACDADLVEMDPAAPGAPAFAMAADPRLVGFLRRTFSNPRFHHPLEAMCAWFCAANPAGAARAGRMLAHFAPGRLDLLAMGDEGPSFANSFACADPLDAVYYVLAVRASLGIDADGELLLCGAAPGRDDAVGVLRRYVRYAMPLPPLAVPAVAATAADAPPPFHVQAMLALAAKCPDNATN